jgi:hypothetical protein
VVEMEFGLWLFLEVGLNLSFGLPLESLEECSPR